MRITISPRRAAVQWALVAVVLFAWGYGLATGWQDLQDPSQAARRAWIAVTRLVWLAAGTFAFVRLGVVAMGRELVEVDDSCLRIRREIMGVGRSRVFDLSQVRGLRHVPPPPVGHAPVERGWPPLPLSLLGGSVRFEGGGRTYELALGIAWEDMEVLLQALREKLR